MGQHVVAALRRGGWTVAALGNPRTGAEATFASAGIPWFPGAVGTDSLQAATAEVGRPELIIHAAGGASVGESLVDPQRDFDRSVGSTLAVLAFMRAERSDARLVFLSSAAVYGSAAATPIPESAPLLPLSPYGLHKKLGEDLVLGWSTLYGLDTAIVRLFSVYGTGLRKQILWELTKQLVQRPPVVTLFGKGDETRDFLFVDDAIRVMGCVAQAGRLTETQIVNGGTGRPVTVRHLAQTLAEAVGVPTMIAFNGIVREGDPKAMVADLTKARGLGFEPAVPLEIGIPHFVAWAKSEFCAE